MPAMTTAHRTSGVAPLYVCFDTVDHDGWVSGVSQPADGDFAKFHYLWSFGDAGAGTWENGRLKSDGTQWSENQATGFIAGHVYNEPGVYNVTLDVINASGTPLAQYTQTITVTAYAGTTVYVSSSDPAASDANTGLVEALPKLTIASAVSVSGTHKQILLKRGDTFLVTSLQTLGAAGPAMISTYGTGAKPRIVGNAEHTYRFFRCSGSDWRLIDLTFISSNSGPEPDCIESGGSNTNVLLCRCDAEIDPGCGWDRVVNFSRQNFSNTQHGNALYKCNFVGACFIGGRHTGVLGSSFDDSANHPMRVWCGYKSVVSYSSGLFGRNTSASTALKLHGQDPATAPNWMTQYTQVSDNVFMGGNAYSVEVKTQGSSPTTGLEVLDHIVVERNLVRFNNGLNNLQVAFYVGADWVTLRNNLIVLDGGATGPQACVFEQYGTEGTHHHFNFINNTIVRTTAASNGVRMVNLQDNASDVVNIANNLVHAPLATTVTVIDGTATNLTSGDNLDDDTPGFTNIPGFDFRLVAGADAINAGSDQGLYGNIRDADGNTRVLGSFDIGALESQGAGTPINITISIQTLTITPLLPSLSTTGLPSVFIQQNTEIVDNLNFTAEVLSDITIDSEI